MSATTVSAPSGSSEKPPARLGLRVGDWVEVRSPEEILGTLDSNQCLEGLPFMPEMLPFCGKRFRVYKTAHKTCDTVKDYAIRRMRNAVHLEGLRCNGEGHGGCEASCLLFWKESWLKRVEQGTAPGDGNPASSPREVPLSVYETLAQGARVVSAEAPAEERFRCQATEIRAATTEVRRRGRWNPLLYVQDVTSGNVSVFEFIRYGAFAMLNAFALRWFGQKWPRLRGTAAGKTPHAALHLQPGEKVAVKSRDAIMATLTPACKNRGLFFDVEMVPFCDQTYNVLRRIEKIVDEKTGRMIKFPSPCLILDGVTCGGKLSSNRMFCPRSVYPFWHEVWLERADSTSDANRP